MMLPSVFLLLSILVTDSLCQSIPGIDYIEILKITPDTPLVAERSTSESNINRRDVDIGELEFVDYDYVNFDDEDQGVVQPHDHVQQRYDDSYEPRSERHSFEHKGYRDEKRNIDLPYYEHPPSYKSTREFQIKLNEHDSPYVYESHLPTFSKVNNAQSKKGPKSRQKFTINKNTDKHELLEKDQLQENKNKNINKSNFEENQTLEIENQNINIYEEQSNQTLSYSNNDESFVGEAKHPQSSQEAQDTVQYVTAVKVPHGMNLPPLNSNDNYYSASQNNYDIYDNSYYKNQHNNGANYNYNPYNKVDRYSHSSDESVFNNNYQRYYDSQKYYPHSHYDSTTEAYSNLYYEPRKLNPNSYYDKFDSSSQYSSTIKQRQAEKASSYRRQGKSLGLDEQKRARIAEENYYRKLEEEINKSDLLRDSIKAIRDGTWMTPQNETKNINLIKSNSVKKQKDKIRRRHLKPRRTYDSHDTEGSLHQEIKYIPLPLSNDNPLHNMDEENHVTEKLHTENEYVKFYLPIKAKAVELKKITKEHKIFHNEPHHLEPSVSSIPTPNQYYPTSFHHEKYIYPTEKPAVLIKEVTKPSHYQDSRQAVKAYEADLINLDLSFHPDAFISNPLKSDNRPNFNKIANVHPETSINNQIAPQSNQIHLDPHSRFNIPQTFPGVGLSFSSPLSFPPSTHFSSLISSPFHQNIPNSFSVPSMDFKNIARRQGRAVELEDEIDKRTVFPKHGYNIDPYFAYPAFGFFEDIQTRK